MHSFLRERSWSTNKDLSDSLLTSEVIDAILSGGISPVRTLALNSGFRESFKLEYLLRILVLYFASVFLNSSNMGVKVKENETKSKTAPYNGAFFLAHLLAYISLASIKTIATKQKLFSSTL